MESSNEIDQRYMALELKIANLESNENALICEKNQMIEDFNIQRAKLKELYLQKEDEIRQGVVGSSELIDELEEMKIKVTNLERELEKVRNQQYKNEHKDYSTFANSSQKGNDNFLRIQRMCLSDIRRLKSFLSRDQLKKFYELQGMEVVPTMRVFSGQENSYDNDTYLELPNKELNEKRESNNAVLNSFNFEGSKHRCEETNINSTEFSSKEMPQMMTDDQKRALSGFYNVETDVEKSLIEPTDGSPHSNITTSPRFVSDQEWNNLNYQIEKCLSIMMEPCRFCVDLELALRKNEVELNKKEKMCDVLKKAAERQVEDLNRETLYRKQSEAKWLDMVQEFQEKEKLFHSRIEKVSSDNSNAINNSNSSLKTFQQQLRKLTDKRESANKELLRLQDENDKLVGKHSSHSQEMQNEIINLPDSIEEMHLLLLKYREDVIVAKVAKETLEESFSSRILFLKDQVLSEQHEKSVIEDKLSNDLEQVRVKLGSFEESQRTIETERSIRVELEAQLGDREQSLADLSEKYHSKISQLKEQLDGFNNTKQQQNHETLELRNRISTLQYDLETSEGVQRDFVRLSQSLQVQLERIRQSEKEVRWQHEEDVDECSSCKQKFTAVGRRKHHCRHCGKIFCNECCSHGVPSGPNRRISKVCDVCHTLLVADATPFFSSDPPNIID